MIRVLLIVCTATLTSALGQPYKGTGTVTFLVVEETGRVLPDWTVKTFSAHSTDLSSRFTGLVGTALPLGIGYKYVLTGPSIRRAGQSEFTPTFEGEIRLDSPERLIIATPTAQDFGWAESRHPLPPSFVIRGTVEGRSVTSGSDPVRLKLHSAVDHRDLDVAVEPNGEFRIYEDLFGLWIATVLRGDEVLSVEPILFARGAQPASFTLKVGDQPYPALRMQ